MALNEHLGQEELTPDAGTGDDAYVADLEARRGIDIEGTENVEIYDVGIQHVYGDFVYLGRRQPNPARAAASRDSIMSLDGRPGISFTEAHDVAGNHELDRQHPAGNIRDLEPNGPSWGGSNISDHGQHNTGPAASCSSPAPASDP